MARIWVKRSHSIEGIILRVKEQRDQLGAPSQADEPQDGKTPGAEREQPSASSLVSGGY